MPQIRVTCKPDGTVQVKAEGFTGETCRAFTAPYTKAIGQIDSDTPTAEAFETSHETEQQRERA